MPRAIADGERRTRARAPVGATGVAKRAREYGHAIDERFATEWEFECGECRRATAQARSMARRRWAEKREAGERATGDDRAR